MTLKQEQSLDENRNNEEIQISSLVTWGARNHQVPSSQCSTHDDKSSAVFIKMSRASIQSYSQPTESEWVGVVDTNSTDQQITSGVLPSLANDHI